MLFDGFEFVKVDKWGSLNVSVCTGENECHGMFIAHLLLIVRDLYQTADIQNSWHFSLITPPENPCLCPPGHHAEDERGGTVHRGAHHARWHDPSPGWVTGEHLSGLMASRLQNYIHTWETKTRKKSEINHMMYTVMPNGWFLLSDFCLALIAFPHQVNMFTHWGFLQVDYFFTCKEFRW